MVDWLQSLDCEPHEIFAEKLPFSLSMLSDSVAVLSKDFKTIPAKVGGVNPMPAKVDTNIMQEIHSVILK